MARWTKFAAINSKFPRDWTCFHPSQCETWDGAYAFIPTHEGYPCVFWQDYFNWNLAQPDDQSGIQALVNVHEQNAAGPTQILFADDDLYITQRSGAADQSGLLFVLNNRGTWNGTWVQTRWNNTRLIPAAWRGRDDLNVPEEKWTNDSGWANLWAPPRGYAVYLPASTEERRIWCGELQLTQPH
jgi:alpha-amylase